MRNECTSILESGMLIKEEMKVMEVLYENEVFITKRSVRK